MERIGANIRKIREKRGLTQEALGKMIGKSSNQIGAYENGSSDIPVSVVYKIQEAMKADWLFLMTGKEQKEEPKPEWDAELRIYNMDDRLTVIGILAKNGYDVGQHKKPKGKGNSLDYFVHAKNLVSNADTSK
jgi:transcriptional regulator with XRE-family HTH domain